MDTDILQKQDRELFEAIANRESAQNPDSYGYHNAIMRYDFEDGELSTIGSDNRSGICR